MMTRIGNATSEVCANMYTHGLTIIPMSEEKAPPPRF